MFVARPYLLIACLSLSSFFSSAARPQVFESIDTDQIFDVVINSGRVIDPETGLDGIRNVGLIDGIIEVISEEKLNGHQLVDAAGLVVAPGFIDIHSHAFSPYSIERQLHDGVTTLLELEAGAYPVAEFAPELKYKAKANYGASVGYGSARIEVLGGIRVVHLVSSKPQPIGVQGYWFGLLDMLGLAPEVSSMEASTEERAEILERLGKEIDSGAIGIGMPLDYFSEGISHEELAGVFQLAAKKSSVIFLHMRRGVNGDPAGLEEALQLAEQYGSSVHICHIQHNAMRNTRLFLDMIAAAQAKGIDVTTETLPYSAGSAAISAAVFKRDWRTIFDIDYSDVQWSETGEYLNEDSFTQYQTNQPNGQVMHHYVKEPWIQQAIKEPGVIIVSDLLPGSTPEQKVAPHIGAFSKILGKYVRQEKLLTLNEAINKMTLLPAKRLEMIAPQFSKKGRLQVGADADITIFDPKTIIDHASYESPLSVSSGVRYVLVNGELVLKDGDVVADAYPGKFLSAP